MCNPERIVENILGALRAAQGKSASMLINDDSFGLPRLIPAGGGGTIQIAKEIDDLIAHLARELKTKRRTLTRSIKDNEWRNWGRTTIGPLLASTSLMAPAAEQAAPLLEKLEDALNGIVANLSPFEYAFGTTLFSNSDIMPFTIGPVVIEPREVWLDRKVAEGDVTSVTQRRVRRIWARSRVGPRKNNREKLREDNILEAIGSCQYVCTVKLSAAFAAEAGLETALTTARLALACVALTFEKPSEALRGFNLQYDGPIYTQAALLFVPDKLTLSGSRLSHHPTGPFM